MIGILFAITAFCPWDGLFIFVVWVAAASSLQIIRNLEVSLTHNCACEALSPAHVFGYALLHDRSSARFLTHELIGEFQLRLGEHADTVFDEELSDHPCPGPRAPLEGTVVLVSRTA